jgi:hypothetical protein
LQGESGVAARLVPVTVDERLREAHEQGDRPRRAAILRDLQEELIHTRPRSTMKHFRKETFDWIEISYNTQWRHSTSDHRGGIFPGTSLVVEHLGRCLFP